MDKNVEYIIQKIREWGATFVGFSNVVNCLDKKFSSLENSITIGVRLSDFIIDQIENMPTYTYFHHYRTANFLLDQISMKATLLLMEKGFMALAVPASQTVHDIEMKHSGIFQHKTGACLAGLGFIGKSGLFISKDYGPRVRLATILTDMPIAFDSINESKTEKKLGKLSCGSCNICVDSCPAKAIMGNHYEEGINRDELINAKKCSDYMNKNFKDIGRGSVCGVCVKVCPFGAKK